MTDTYKQKAIPYTLGFSIYEHPLADGESIDVEFLSTVARITRNSADDYKLETMPPNDPKTPGRGAPHGIYTNFIVAQTSFGCQYSEAVKKTHEKAEHLTANEVDNCIAKLGNIMVNTQKYHDEELARREAEAPKVVITEPIPASTIIPGGKQVC